LWIYLCIGKYFEKNNISNLTGPSPEARPSSSQPGPPSPLASRPWPPPPSHRQVPCVPGLPRPIKVRPGPRVRRALDPRRRRKPAAPPPCGKPSRRARRPPPAGLRPPLHVPADGEPSTEFPSFSSLDSPPQPSSRVAGAPQSRRPPGPPPPLLLLLCALS
jgi:hypothetical protein